MDAAPAGTTLTTHEIIDALCRYTDGEAGNAYVRNHAERYRETLALMPVDQPLDVLDLGAFIPLTALLRRVTPHRYTLHAAAGGEPCCEVKAGGEVFSLSCFDVEQETFPFAAGSFDMVLCAEVLEHLGLDPCFMLAEVNRVLRPGGRLLLTTPNAISTRNTAKALLGYTPSFYTAFTLTRDRHNREYSPGEVAAMLTACGFAARQLFTRNAFYPEHSLSMRRIAGTIAMRLLLSLLGRAQLRGDAIFVLAQKTGPVANRYPEQFYDLPERRR